MKIVFTESSHDSGTGGYTANKSVSDVQLTKIVLRCAQPKLSQMSRLSKPRKITKKYRWRRLGLEPQLTIGMMIFRLRIKIFFLAPIHSYLGGPFQKRHVLLSLPDFREISEFRSSSIHVRWAFGVVWFFDWTPMNWFSRFRCSSNRCIFTIIKTFIYLLQTKISFGRKHETWNKHPCNALSPSRLLWIIWGG